MNAEINKVSLSKDYLDAFDMEELRDLCAKTGDLSLFRKLYSTKYPSIKNRNYGYFWDDINFSRGDELKRSPIYKDKIETVFNLVKDKKGNIFNVGFGNGLLELRLKNRHQKLYGLDISSASVNRIKKLVNGIFRKGNVVAIPFGDKTFDTVLALDILEHVSPKDIFQALHEIYRVMKTRSVLIITVPLNEGLKEMIVNKNINPNAHVRTYTYEILKAELTIAGFEVVSVNFFFAFRWLYRIKKLFVSVFPFFKIKPNLLLIVAKKS